MRKTAIALALAASALASPAFAAYQVTVYTGTVGSAFDAVLASTSLFANGTNNASKATFTYNGALNFSNTSAQNNSAAGDLNSSFFTTPANITNYAKVYGPNGNVAYSNVNQAFNNLSNFLASSGSVAGYAWGSLYTFDSDAGNYGGQTLTITHDDGVSVYLNGSSTAIAGFTAGPTSAITESVVLGANVSSYRIVYGRENGSPSVLQLSLSGAVPEPATWAMMVAGFGVIGFSMRRRPTRVTYAV
ncbi:MAG: PEPxxWA-CTERM sorting domain-containing protein [Sphingomonadales bacterium]